MSTGQGMNGHNMFVYCGNNPVMYSDPTGECYGYANDPNLDSKNSGVEFGYNCGDYGYHARHPRTDETDDSPNALDSNGRVKNKYVPRKDKRKGSENRQKSGERERNRGHKNGEEHSIKPKGNGRPIVKRILDVTALVGAAVATVVIIADDATVIGILDDPLFPVIQSFAWDIAASF